MFGPGAHSFLRKQSLSFVKRGYTRAVTQDVARVVTIDTQALVFLSSAWYRRDLTSGCLGVVAPFESLRSSVAGFMSLHTFKACIKRGKCQSCQSP